jgi:SulP family sulfate permease
MSNTGPTDLRSPSSHRGALFRRYVPAVQWMGDYRSSWFKADAIAAISVWALLVPQALAYSSIAGVPPEYGLYAAFAALVAYGLFGTSRQLVQGPSAAVAAVSAAVVTPLVGASAMGTEDAVPMTAALAIVTGIVYLIFGVFRLGWVSNFLSKAVISGFILGLSIGIIIDQSHKLLGVAAVDGSYWDILVGTIEEIPDTDATTLVVGATALLALLLMRRFTPRLPRALIVMVTSIAWSRRSISRPKASPSPARCPSACSPWPSPSGRSTTTAL